MNRTEALRKLNALQAAVENLINALESAHATALRIAHDANYLQVAIEELGDLLESLDEDGTP